MRLNARAVFWAVALAAAASYVLCAVLVAVAPGLTSRTFSWVMHIDLTGMARSITWASFFGGMLSFSLFLGLLGWAFASIYNRIAEAPNG